MKKICRLHKQLYPYSYHLHILVVKQPKCHLVGEAAALISTSSFCSGPGITSSNLVVSYLLENISLIRQISLFVTAWTPKAATQTLRPTYKEKHKSARVNIHHNTTDSLLHGHLCWYWPVIISKCPKSEIIIIHIEAEICPTQPYSLV